MPATFMSCAQSCSQLTAVPHAAEGTPFPELVKRQVALTEVVRANRNVESLPRMAILSNGGGLAVLATDRLIDEGGVFAGRLRAADAGLAERGAAAHLGPIITLWISSVMPPGAAMRRRSRP